MNQSVLEQYRKLGILPVSGGSGDPPGGDPPAKGDPPAGDPAKPSQDDPPAYKPPSSQEEFDLMVASRLRRQEKSLRDEIKAELKTEAETAKKAEDAKAQGKFEELLAIEQQKSADLAAKVQELTDSLAERDQKGIREEIGKKHNLPPELWDRLVGEDEKALEADAKKIAATIQVKPANTEGGAGSSKPGAKQKTAPSGNYQFRRNPVVPFPDRQQAAAAEKQA